MGYVTAFGSCIVCNGLFSFNPKYVPSITIKGTREPICQNCIETINVKRATMKVLPIAVHPEAYEPLDENEMGDGE
jgi:hypothetical protein